MVTQSKKDFIRKTLMDCRLVQDNSPETKGFWLYTPDYEVEDYPKFKEMVTDLGGQWKRKGFFFKTNPQSALQKVLNKGISWKQLTQYFPTPHEVVELMMECLPTGPEFWHGKRILEPSAGRGNILMHILLQTGYLRLNAQKTGVDFLPMSTVDLCEFDEFNYLCLENKIPQQMGYERVGTDFMQLSEDRQYDIIMANPPFTGNQWLTHYRKMLRHLAPGGSIVCVLPQKAEVEPGLLDGLIDGKIIPLPAKSFKKSKTNADTCIVMGKRSGETARLPLPALPALAPQVFTPKVSRHGQYCMF